MHILIQHVVEGEFLMHWPNDLNAHNIEITTSQIINMNFPGGLEHVICRMIRISLIGPTVVLKKLTM